MRHGDCYDHFNFDPEKGRDSGTLGDVFAMEVLNVSRLKCQSNWRSIA